MTLTTEQLLSPTCSPNTSDHRLCREVPLSEQVGGACAAGWEAVGVGGRAARRHARAERPLCCLVQINVKYHACLRRSLGANFLDSLLHLCDSRVDPFPADRVGTLP